MTIEEIVGKRIVKDVLKELKIYLSNIRSNDEDILLVSALRGIEMLYSGLKKEKLENCTLQEIKYTSFYDPVVEAIDIGIKDYGFKV
jgi:hypothetical protein